MLQIFEAYEKSAVVLYFIQSWNKAYYQLKEYDADTQTADSGHVEIFKCDQTLFLVVGVRPGKKYHHNKCGES